MGLIDKSRRSHEGSEQSRQMREPSALTLPIFGTNFEGHGVYRRGFGDRNPAPGESAEGWGVHADSTVDCLDVRQFRTWKLGSSADSWASLWSAEASPNDIRVDSQSARSAFLSRIVVLVQIVYSGVVFIPDPLQWAVHIPSPNWMLDGCKGYLVPRPATDKGGAEARNLLTARRSPTGGKC